MATVTEMREWLRSEGVDVPERGRLRPDLVDQYNAAHAADDPDWDTAELDGDMAAADDEPSVPLEPERRPRTARAVRAERRSAPRVTRVERGLSRLLAGDQKQKPGAKKKAPPRISLEKFTARLYSSMGRAVRVISPATSNCLQAQAAMAGVLLEETVRNTTVDRLIQPLAKAEDKLNAGFALIAPPLVVFALEQSAQLPPREAAIRQAFLMPVLRESLRLGLEVSEGFADQIRESIERNARWDAEVDALIALIFADSGGGQEAVTEPEMQPA